MAAPQTDKVRNVVLVGQGGVGKTKLAEAMLHLTGKTARLGGHAGSKPTLDFDPEESKRNFSISTSIAPVEHKGCKINVLDAPCYPDFIGDAYAAISVAETALFVVDAVEGPQPTTVKLWYATDEQPVARAVFINRIDKDNADLDLTMAGLQDRFGNHLGLVSIPMGVGPDFKGLIDVIHMQARTYDAEGKEIVGEIPAEYADAAASAREALCDLAVEADEELMMKYLEGEALTQEELEGLLGTAIAQRMLVPVYVGAAVQEPGMELICARTQSSERLGHLYLMCGRETTDVKKALAGDIIVVPKLEVNTGDTLSATGKVEAQAFRFSNSLYQVAIRAKNRNEEDKLSAFLEKTCDADPTISVTRNEETHQTVVSAVGEAQVSVMVNRLAERTGVEAILEPLRIPYRETIRKAASAQGRHKKQTGGAGQFGDCWLRLEPNPGGGYEFLDEIVGGKIPRQYIPAVDKGIQETLTEGVLAGYPMVDVKVACYDGSYHPVDSSEIAFKTAARIGFRAAAEHADPVILEPMANMTITVPDAYAGAVTGDISASRGRVTGMDSDGRGNTVVIATVPFAEITDYSTRLRSLSRGTGEFSYELEGYEQVPYDTAAKLVEAYQKSRSEGR